MMDKDTAKAINNLSNKVNEVSERLNNLINLLTEKNKADIDYLAMMTDVDIPEKSVREVNDEQ